MVHDDLFSLRVGDDGRKNTNFFGMMAKVAGILIVIDKHLLAMAKGLRRKFVHVLHSDIFSNIIKIEEVTAYEGDNNATLRLFMKEGKELILSSLMALETTSELDKLQNNLSALFYKTQERFTSNGHLEFTLEHSRINKEYLARLLWCLWLFIDRNRSLSNTIYVESLPGPPKVTFIHMPPLVEWLPPINVESGEGLFVITHANFQDRRKWKAILINYFRECPLEIEIADFNFLEGLKSTKANDKNGILDGDVIKAYFTKEYDPIRDKTTITIHNVLERLHGNDGTQLNLKLSDNDAAQEPPPEPDKEPPKKLGKKKHRSWR